MATFEKFDENKTYFRHEKAYPQGGVQLKDDPNSTVNTRDVFVGLIKSVGGKLKEGKILDLLKVSRPAIISYPRTYLECVIGDFQHTKLLDQAAVAKNPVERLKFVTAFFVSGLYRNSVEMGNTGPLNPILGETFSAVKADGTKLYCEQISHHPPVSAYLMYHPEGLYRLHGQGEVTAKMGGLNSICGSRLGQTIVEFKDGSKVKVTNPEMRIDGIMMGDRTINYCKSFFITDTTNNISAEIAFNYVETGTLSKIGSKFKSFFVSPSSDKPVYDTFTVTICKLTRNKETKAIMKNVVSRGSGSWLSYIEFDDDIYWKIKDTITDLWICSQPGKLQSDSTKRLDTHFIKMKNFDKAQKEKEILENMQRNDSKLRKANAPKPSDKAMP
jgi:hypothetical protein